MLFCSAPAEKGRDMTRRTLYLPALLVAAVLVACAGTSLTVSEKAEATFPGKNGKIAYVRNNGNDEEIYTINPGGGGKIQLTRDNTGNYVPSYSPDGKKIVYSGSTGPGDGEIYTINASGRGKIQLTHNDREDFYPSYSPDGQERSSTCTTAQTTVNSTRSTCAQGTRSSSPTTIGKTSTLPIRPTARRSSTRAPQAPGTPRSTPSTPVGGGKIQLTHNNTDEFDPDYSPDGKRIAYTGLNRRYDKSAIYTIGVRGGGKSRVTEGSDPSYSPDGKKIAYAVYKGPFTGIYKINVGGGGKARVTPRLESAESPSWGSRP